MLAPSRGRPQRALEEPCTPRWLQGLDDLPLLVPGRPRDRGRWPRARRIGLITAALIAVPALVSYASMLTQRSDSSLSIRTVEWLRDNGLRAVVNKVESVYYTLNAPATGGAALRALPKLPGAENAVTAAGAQARRVYYRPPRIRPIIQPALPGEGVWHSTFAHSGDRPPVLVTSFRPRPQLPAERRRRGLDRPHQDLGLAVPRTAGAGSLDARQGADGGPRGHA